MLKAKRVPSLGMSKEIKLLSIPWKSPSRYEPQIQGERLLSQESSTEHTSQQEDGN